MLSHEDNEKDALMLAFIDIKLLGVKQHVSEHTHYGNHTLDLMWTHGKYIIKLYNALHNNKKYISSTFISKNDSQIMDKVCMK